MLNNHILIQPHNKVTLRSKLRHHIPNGNYKNKSHVVFLIMTESKMPKEVGFNFRHS